MPVRRPCATTQRPTDISDTQAFNAVNDRTPLSLKILRDLQLKRVLGLVWKAAPGWTLANGALLSLQAGLPLLQLYFMKLTVDAVTAGIVAPEKTSAITRVVVLVCLTGGAALAADFLSSIARVVGQAQAEVVSDYVQNLLHSQSVALDLEYYENSRFHDTLLRAQQEAPYRPIRMVTGLIQVGQNCVVLIGIAALLVSCHWGITVLLFAAVVPGALVRLKFAGRLYQWQLGRSEAERTAVYLNGLLTGEGHAKEIRLFDLGPLLMRRSRKLRQQLRQEKMRIAFKRALGELAAQSAATLAIYGSFSFIAYRTLQGGMTVGDLVMYYQAFQRGQGYLRELLSGMAGLFEDNLFLSNFYHFLDLKPAVTVSPPSVPVPRPMKEGIVFDRVGFRYPVGAKMVLHEVSLAIRPGQVVALVGENGSGKTTLAKLLCRLYDPTAGAIRLDGIDLRRFDCTALRAEIGIIFQDYARYYMTARENIWMGNTHLPPDDPGIVAAAQRAGAHEMLAALPHGYETKLGKGFGNGTELSIGQWQQVALARAFLRNAQILVLDEPTSSLDAKAEYAVFQNFRQLASGRTAILISHRFSTIRMADRIFVLQDGKITEDGTHEELMLWGGTYARLYEIQAHCYK
jgi:ATP-binding cassette, subfamily B, bacterial